MKDNSVAKSEMRKRLKIIKQKKEKEGKAKLETRRKKENSWKGRSENGTFESCDTNLTCDSSAQDSYQISVLLAAADRVFV